MTTAGTDSDAAAELLNAQGRGPVLLVCEHASRHIPPEYGDLGLPEALLDSHIAWDPGALAVAQHLVEAFDAPLVAARQSRLLFDCNRPPEAADAMAAVSEGHAIPGNTGLSDAARAERVRRYHDPFRACLAEALDRFTAAPVFITLHSFTPVYLGVARQVEIGLLHDDDDRLARAMRTLAARHGGGAVALNQPYGPQDGVTHTLRTHALPCGALNVMIEIRNDLIASPETQRAMAARLAPWIAEAAGDCGAELPLREASCPE